MTSIQTFTLTQGSHDEPDHGMCVMEAVSFVAGEKFSDVPLCADPLLIYPMQTINDGMGNERKKLIPLIPRLAGSRGQIDHSAFIDDVDALFDETIRHTPANLIVSRTKEWADFITVARTGLRQAREWDHAAQDSGQSRPVSDYLYHDVGMCLCRALGLFLVSGDVTRLIDLLDKTLPKDGFCIPEEFSEIRSALAEADLSPAHA